MVEEGAAKEKQEKGKPKVRKVGFYHPGFVRQGKTQEKDLIPTVTFVYKPLSHHQSSMWDGELINAKPGLALEAKGFQLLGKQLVNWDLEECDEKGQPIIDEATKQAKVVDFKDPMKLELVDPSIIEDITQVIKAAGEVPWVEEKN